MGKLDSTRFMSITAELIFVSCLFHVSIVEFCRSMLEIIPESRWRRPVDYNMLFLLQETTVEGWRRRGAAVTVPIHLVVTATRVPGTRRTSLRSNQPFHRIFQQVILLAYKHSHIKKKTNYIAQL